MIKYNSRLLNNIIRTYATSASQSIDHHEKYNLHPWPKSKNPTPYEIFNIKNDELNLSIHEFNKLLKSSYLKFIRIYHPDVSRNIIILDNNYNELTNEMKRNRFDQIKNAYDVLRDPKRRIAYKNYHKTSWENYQSGATTFEAYKMANAHRKKYAFDNDEEFWRAGTWEDYYRMKYKRPPPTKEEFEKNKYKILAGVLLVCGLSASLQVMLAIDKTNEYYRQTKLLNLKSLQDLQDSRDNYGEGLSKFQRLRRFLLVRRASLIDEDGVKLDDLKNEDNEILTKYAKQQVEKFT